MFQGMFRHFKGNETQQRKCCGAFKTDEDDPIDMDTTSQRLQDRNTLNNSVIIKGELSSAQIKYTGGNNYEKLEFAFNNFRNIMQNTFQQKKL